MSGGTQPRDQDLWSAAGIKQEYKFVDEAAKLSSKEGSRNLPAPATDQTPSLDFSTGPAEGGSGTPAYSACSLEIEKINPRLFADADTQSIEPSMPDTIDTVDLTGVDEGMTSQQDRKDFLDDGTIAHGRVSWKQLFTSYLTV